MANPYHSDVKLAQEYARKATHTFTQRGIPYLLSFEEYKELRQAKVCEISGVELVKWKSGENKGKAVPDNVHTIDRIDSSAAYTKRNCMAVTFIVNNAKGSLDQFVEMKTLSTEAKLALLRQAESLLVERLKDETATKHRASKAFSAKFGMLPRLA